MIDSVSSNNNYYNSVNQNSAANNNESIAQQNNVQAQNQQAQTASSAQEDDVVLSSQANQLIDSGNEENYETHQVGGVGANITGDMSVDQMKTALAEARGISEKDVIVINGSGENDNIEVKAGKKGGIIVSVNGQEKEYTAEEASRMIINGGDGNDNISVGFNVFQGLVIMGGDGDDTIQGGSGDDTIVGGQGNDTLYGNGGNDRLVDDFGANIISGGEGNDVIIAHSSEGNKLFGANGDDYIEGGDGNDVIEGGAGYDVLYGLGGDDTISGGSGKDYIDGGLGNDTLNGGAGDDILVGGQGNDILKAGSGNDLIIGGAGADTVTTGKGNNRVINDGSDAIDQSKGNTNIDTIAPIDVPKNLSIDGDHYAQERISSDLDFLASIPQGQRMLNELAASGHKVTFDITTKGSSCGSYSGLNSDPTKGSDSFVHYNVNKISLGNSAGWADRAPVVSMYHEMCHSYNAAYGTMNLNYYNQSTGELSNSSDRNAAKGVEWQAVGLNNSDVVANDPYLTENGLRDLLGFERRERY